MSWIEAGSKRINLEHVTAMERMGNGSLNVHLSGGDVINVSGEHGHEVWTAVKVRRHRQHAEGADAPADEMAEATFDAPVGAEGPWTDVG